MRGSCRWRPGVAHPDLQVRALQQPWRLVQASHCGVTLPIMVQLAWQEPGLAQDQVPSLCLNHPIITIITITIIIIVIKTVTHVCFKKANRTEGDTMKRLLCFSTLPQGSSCFLLNPSSHFLCISKSICECEYSFLRLTHTRNPVSNSFLFTHEPLHVSSWLYI